MSMVKIFFKNHKNTTVIFIICMVVYLSYQITIDLPELISGIDIIYRLLSDLSLAYMGSFIFYIVITYIPEQKRQQKLEISIKRNIYMVLKNMRNSLNYMSSDWEYHRNEEKINNDNLDIKQFNDMFNDFCSHDYSPMVDGFGNHVINIRYINYFVNECNSYIDRLYNLMIMDIDYELIEIIDNIRDSLFHNIYSSMAEANTPKAIEEKDANYLYKYYLLYKELNSYFEKLK